LGRRVLYKHGKKGGDSTGPFVVGLFLLTGLSRSDDCSAVAAEALKILDYVVLACSDVATMRRFYTDHLGLAVTYERADWIEFKLENMTMALRPRKEPFFAPKTADLHEASVQLAFRVPPAEVDRRFEKLSGSGVSILDPPRYQSWGHRTFYLADPEGNVLEIYSDLEPPAR
jgi:catechol 2,3-dioxygenase-like lactoylglutathione lyase family enzyme